MWRQFGARRARLADESRCSKVWRNASAVLRWVEDDDDDDNGMMWRVVVERYRMQGDRTEGS